MCGGRLSRTVAGMHPLIAEAVVTDMIAERRRFAARFRRRIR
jgi:hypothetical protein